MVRLGVEGINGFERQLRNAQGVVDGGNGADFLLVCQVGVGRRAEQCVARGLVGPLQGVDEEERFFTTQNVAAVLLTEYTRVAVHVEVVVLHLEGQSQFLSKAVERVGIGLGRIGSQCAHLGSASQEHGGFEAYHFDVLFDGDVGACLEVDVVLLPLANFAGGVCKEAYDFVAVRPGIFQEFLEGHDEHRVAREDGRVVVPLAVHGGKAAAHVGTVHQVVVQQRVVVVGFQAYGGGHHAVHVVAIEAVGQQHQCGAQAFASHVEHVAYGFIEPFGAGGVGHFSQRLFNGW